MWLWTSPEKSGTSCTLLRRASTEMWCWKTTGIWLHWVRRASLWVMSDSLGPHGLRHARLLCPLLFSRVFSNSCPLSRWRDLNISSSVAPFSLSFRSFPTSGSFPVNHLFSSGSYSVGASALAVAVLPMNILGWFPLGLTGLISLQSERFSRVFFSTTVRKHEARMEESQSVVETRDLCFLLSPLVKCVDSEMGSFILLP